MYEVYLYTFFIYQLELYQICIVYTPTMQLSQFLPTHH